MAHSDDAPVPEEGESGIHASVEDFYDMYESPAVVDLGSVRQATQGNANDGNADATNQFYR